jgi:hypothetical protein
MANLTLKLLLAILPLAAGKKGLVELFRLMAAAGDGEVPDLRGRSRREMLQEFARFTRNEAERSLAGGTADAERKNLYARSADLGRAIRRRLPMRSRADATAAIQRLYGLLDIDMRIAANGAVTVGRCFFATRYTPETCRFMAAMDEGIVAGICGGRLVFTQRLSEGAEACRARIEWPEGENE